MIPSDDARRRHPLALVAAATVAVTTLVVPASAAAGGKPTTQSTLKVGPTGAGTGCSVTFTVENPNSNGQKIEVGATNTATLDKVYSTTRIGAGEIKHVTVSVAGAGSYAGFATNSAGRDDSDVPATITC